MTDDRWGPVELPDDGTDLHVYTGWSPLLRKRTWSARGGPWLGHPREVDYPARYGGEELALILPHTDMPGSYAIAERIRSAIESIRISRVDGDGVLRVTASLGVAASTDGSKEDLIAEADSALYEAKRQGKNRTVKAGVQAANVSGGG